MRFRFVTRHDLCSTLSDQKKKTMTFENCIDQDQAALSA